MYIRDADPENAVDLKSYKETLGQLLGEWHENDTDAVAEAMAKFLTGPQDSFAERELVRVIRDRANRIIERDNENRQTGPEE
jgi:hypothetical protein